MDEDEVAFQAKQRAGMPYLDTEDNILKTDEAS